MRSSPFALLDARLVAAGDRTRLSPLLAQDFAHRGLHGTGVPENSLAAARAAIDAGLGIECDVRRTQDGAIVVVHDAEDGDGRRIDKTDRAALAPLADGMPVPTLADLLACIGGSVPLLVEIKPTPRTVATCLGVRRAIEGYRGAVAVMSFDPAIPRWFADQAPGVLRGLVVSERKGVAEAFRRRRAILHARPQFVAWDVRCLPSRLAAALRHRVPVLAWTVRPGDPRGVHADRAIIER